MRIPGTVFYNMKAKKYELAFRTKTKKKKRAETEPVKMEEKRLTLVIGD